MENECDYIRMKLAVPEFSDRILYVGVSTQNWHVPRSETADLVLWVSKSVSRKRELCNGGGGVWWWVLFSLFVLVRSICYIVHGLHVSPPSLHKLHTHMHTYTPPSLCIQSCVFAANPCSALLMLSSGCLLHVGIAWRAHTHTQTLAYTPILQSLPLCVGRVCTCRIAPA